MMRFSKNRGIYLNNRSASGCGSAGSGSADVAGSEKKPVPGICLGRSMFVYYGRKKAVLIHMPTEKELYEKGIFTDEG